MLSNDEKNALIDQRVREYEIKIFNLEIDLVALKVVGDESGIKASTTRIESLKKAMDAVQEMRV